MLNTFDKTSEHERRRTERERQQSVMETVKTNSPNKVLPSGTNTTDVTPESSRSLVADVKDGEYALDGDVPTGVHAPPRGAIENARKFLWEEDEQAQTEVPGRSIDWNRKDGLFGSIMRKSTTNDPNVHHPVGYTVNFGAEGAAGGGGGGQVNLAPHKSPRERGGGGAGYGRSSDTSTGSSYRDPNRSSFSGSVTKFGHSVTQSIKGLGLSRGGAGTSERNLQTIDFEKNISPRRHSGSHLDQAAVLGEDPHDKGKGTWTFDELWHSESYARERTGGGSGNYNGPFGACLMLMRLLISRKCLAFIFMFAVTVGAVVSLTVVAKNDNNDNNGGSSSSDNDAAQSSNNNDKNLLQQNLLQQNLELINNSESDTSAIRFGEIKQRIIDSGLTPQVELDTDGQPQHDAVRWLSFHDEMYVSPEDPYLLQRYGLAVFFFSTYDQAVLNDDDGTIDKSAGGDENKVWLRATNWMSGKGYCSWYGIQCHHNGQSTTYDDNGGITHLNLTSNNLLGYMPYEINALKNDLRVLDMGQNGLEGYVPETIGELTELVTLYIGSNQYSGTIPTEFGKLTKLTHVYVSDNLLTGNIPSEIGQMTMLSSIGFHQNNLEGPIPKEIGNIPELFVLYLDQNDLTGSIPTEIGKLTSVSDMRLSKNKLSGPIPEEIGQMEDLEQLYLDNNELGGSIPMQLYELMRLDEAHLYNNKLSGNIPEKLGMLGDLNILYLDHNELEGKIGEAFLGGLYDLEHLYLDQNKLTGTLPTMVGRMENIRHLRLYDNQLTGTLPTEIGKLYKIEDCYLHNNEFSGSLPTEMGQLEYLARLRVNGNDITGSAPAELCALTEERHLEEFHSDCDGEVPEIKCTCCTQCFSDETESG